jgi:hypothetical protein
VIREDMKYDVRALKYRLRRNEISKKELDKHLAALPDDAAEAETTNTGFAATFEERNYRQ